MKPHRFLAGFFLFAVLNAGLVCAHPVNVTMADSVVSLATNMTKKLSDLYPNTGQSVVFNVAFTDASPVPSLTLPGVTNNEFRFTVTGTPGTNCVAQAATNLAAPAWVSLATNAAPFSLVETNASLFPQRFYRALVAP